MHSAEHKHSIYKYLHKQGPNWTDSDYRGHSVNYSDNPIHSGDGQPAKGLLRQVQLVNHTDAGLYNTG